MMQIDVDMEAGMMTACSKAMQHPWFEENRAGRDAKTKERVEMWEASDVLAHDCPCDNDASLIW